MGTSQLVTILKKGKTQLFRANPIFLGIDSSAAVFEFYDSRAGCRSVTKRLLWFGIFTATIPICYGKCWAMPHSWFALWFANFSGAHVRLRRQSGLR